MDVHHIKYFLAVCETMNFTRAAEACKVTQPALSRAIQQLEDEVGGLLFRRERSLTHLTDLGLVMQPRLRQIMDELSHARREAKRFLAQDKTRLAIGVMCTIAPMRFAGLIAEFGRRHPGIALRVEEGTPERLMAKLEKRSIDLAVLATPAPLAAPFESTPLYDERFVVALPAGHRLLSLQVVPLSLLDGESYLSRINCEYAGSIGETCASRGVRLHDAYASEREDWIQNLVSGGLGIAMVPEFTAVAPGLQIRPIVEPEIWRDIRLVKLASAPPSAAAKAFTGIIRAYPWPQSRFGSLSSAA